MANDVDLIERLALLDTPTLSDALDALGLPGTVSGISPMWECGRIAGRVQTLQLGPVTDTPSASRPHLGANSIALADSGDVIVVDNRAGEGFSAGWGGLLGLAAKLQGVAGVVVYGACRDVDDLATEGFPLFAHSATPRTARSRTVEVSTNQPLTFDEVIVSAGDLVIADRSGVVFILRQRAEEVLETAEEIFAKEQEMVAQLRDGASVTDVLAGNYETMLESKQPAERKHP